jgi:hypothetical protein
MKNVACAILVCVIYCNSLPVSAQFTITGRSNLIYFADAGNINSDKGQYLVPLIENQIRKLKFFVPGNLVSGDSMFSTVSNLNMLASKRAIDSSFFKVLDYFDNARATIVRDSLLKQVKNADSLIRHRVQGNQFFLKININILNSLIEYQFTLFPVINTSGKVYPDLSRYRYYSVFIDPLNPNYKSKLELALKNIFTEANKPPEPILLMGNEKCDSVIYLEKSRRYEFQASEIDDDTLLDQVKYFWRISDDSSTTSIFSSPQDKNQFYIPHKNGSFEIQLRVFDGIQDSTKKFAVLVEDKPRINLTLRDPRKWEFHRNTLNLYSRQKSYDGGDFYNDDPVLNITTDADDSNSISFELLRAKSYGILDTATHLEKVPISRGAGPAPDDYDYTISGAGASINRDSLHVFSYQINPTDFDKTKNVGIPIPSTDYLKLTVRRHGISSSEIIRIKYHKISPISVFMQQGYAFGREGDNESRFITSLPGVNWSFKSFDIGLSAGLSSKDNYSVFNGKFNYLYLWKFYLMSKPMHYKSIYYAPGLASYNHSYFVTTPRGGAFRANSFGVNMAISIISGDGIFQSSNKPDLILGYYFANKNGNGNTRNTDLKMYEIALRFNFLLEKRVK